MERFIALMLVIKGWDDHSKKILIAIQNILIHTHKMLLDIHKIVGDFMLSLTIVVAIYCEVPLERLATTRRLPHPCES